MTFQVSSYIIIWLIALLSLAIPNECLGEEVQMDALKQNLYKHVEVLSGEIGERSLTRYNNLEKASDYIKKQLMQLDYEVEEQAYSMHERDYRNLIATKRGHITPDEIVLVGAHYDTVTGTPGADDNASGVAGLLELARLVNNLDFKRTVRFVAFSLEEPPIFRTRYMGSRVYADRASREGENITAMICLECIGYYNDKEGSQEFPLPLMNLFYSKRANFIAVVGNLSSWRLVRRVKKSLKEGCQVPVETLVGPSLVPGVDFSDHASFWEEGYPAVMVTDSAFYRNPHYHLPGDTIKTLNFDSLAEVVKGLLHTIRNLAEAGKPALFKAYRKH